MSSRIPGFYRLPPEARLSALESAQEGRTSITIAHRLSTIKNCTVIFVVKDGQVKPHLP